MAENSFPKTLDEGFDLEFTLKFFKRWGPIVAKIFRLEVNDLNKFDLKKGGVIVANHNAGCGGVLDMMIVGHCWYNLLEQKRPLSIISEDFVFKVLGVGDVARKIGLKSPSMACLKDCLKDDNWVGMVPGGNTDQWRTIWDRNRAKMSKAVYIDGELKYKPQTWFIEGLIEKNIPIYPFAISGAHESTPILWQSPLIFKLTGLQYIHKGRFWAGFPFTLNHIINLGIFLLTPFASNPIAWLIFILANIYIEFLYCYPIFPTKIKVKVGDKIDLSTYCNKSINSIKEKKVIRLKVLDQISASINNMLDHLSKKGMFRSLEKYFLKAK